ncbi:amidohydrolase family protein [Herbidospora daliensis]|uniref:amidohydrolase family protein n=1 Tax=Herbidospora daliensis TaxID=295585 RepID=UPI000780A700|nr:amidohydrolase family protein [Herbidospora daliensis]
MSRLLIRGGTVYQADPGHTVTPGGSVLIDDGVIAGFDDAPDAEVVDATGMLVLPGFVNPHWHEMFALRYPFKGALRPASDRGDKPAFMAHGGDIPAISTAFDRFHGLVDALTDDEALAVARYSLWTQLRSGVTTLGDVGSVNKPAALARAAREFGMRLSVSAWVSDAVCGRRTRDAAEALARVEGLMALQDAFVRVRPTSVYATNMTDELGAGLRDLCAKHDLPFAAHVGALRNEAMAMEAYFGVTPVRRFADLGLLDERFTAVHCAFATAEERELLVRAGAHVTHSPAKYGPAGESTLTETRQIPALRAAGLDVSLSTDGASLPVPGMAENMTAAWQAYTEMAADPTALLPSDALAMATRIAAKGLGFADVGSLEVGNRADLVLIRADDWRYLLNPRPLEAFLTLGGSADVETVIVNGRVVKADEDTLRADYLEALRSFSVRCLGVELS